MADIFVLWNQDNTVILKFLVVNMLVVAVTGFHILDRVSLDNSQEKEVLENIEGQWIQNYMMVHTLDLESHYSRLEVYEGWVLLSEDIGDLGYQQCI